MRETEARAIAKELASEIGLPIRSGAVLVHVAGDGAYELWVSADSSWLAGRRLPKKFKGLNVSPTGRIVGEAHFKLKCYA